MLLISVIDPPPQIIYGSQYVYLQHKVIAYLLEVRVGLGFFHRF